MAAYRLARTRRIRAFILRLDAVTQEMSEADRRLLTDYVKSETGFQLLADYAEAVVRATSQTAIHALAILYSDAEDQAFTASFKAKAARAVDGIREPIIDAFLTIMRSRESLSTAPTNGPGQVYSLRDTDPSTPTLPAELADDGETWVPSIAELVHRGLIAPDPTEGRRLGDSNEEWSCIFSVTSDSECFFDLLEAARGSIAQDVTPA